MACRIFHGRLHQNLRGALGCRPACEVRGQLRVEIPGAIGVRPAIYRACFEHSHIDAGRLHRDVATVNRLAEKVVGAGVGLRRGLRQVTFYDQGRGSSYQDTAE